LGGTGQIAHSPPGREVDKEKQWYTRGEKGGAQVQTWKTEQSNGKRTPDEQKTKSKRALNFFKIVEEQRAFDEKPESADRFLTREASKKLDQIVSNTHTKSKHTKKKGSIARDHPCEEGEIVRNESNRDERHGGAKREKTAHQKKKESTGQARNNDTTRIPHAPGPHRVAE